LKVMVKPVPVLLSGPAWACTVPFLVMTSLLGPLALMGFPSTVHCVKATLVKAGIRAESRSAKNPVPKICVAPAPVWVADRSVVRSSTVALVCEAVTVSVMVMTSPGTGVMSAEHGGALPAHANHL
jgi:hypothetical protein